MTLIFKLFILTLIFLLDANCSYAVNPTPAEIDDAIEELGEWHLRTTNHQKFMSATPLGRLRSLAEFLPFDDADFGWDFGYSIMKVPLGDKIKNDYIILGFDPNSIPDDINLTRFHFSQAFGQLFDLGVSALIVPDIDYYGAGLNLSLNVFNFEMLYTTMSLKYAQSKTDRVFSSSSLGFGISQSVNLNWIDLFAGVNYIKGSTTFTPTGAANELPINDVNASGVETYIGGVLVLTGNLRGTFQINNTNAEQTFGMKISFKISSFMPLVPLWMTTEDHF